jgi:hypothetical protein
MNTLFLVILRHVETDQRMTVLITAKTLDIAIWQATQQSIYDAELLEVYATSTVCQTPDTVDMEV